MSSPALPSLWDRLLQSRGRSLDLLGLGECSLDRVLRLPGRLADLAALLTDTLSGGKLRAESVARVGGGQIATALCAASRLGLRTAFAGVVGDDSDGREILAGLAEDGVDVGSAQVLPGVPTRTALILVDSQGERLVIEHRDPMLHPRPERSLEDRLTQTRVVHVDATFPASALRLLARARAQGCIGSLDLDHAGPDALGLLQAADLTVLAAGVAGQITGESDPRDALCALTLRLGKPLVATLGEAGSLLSLPGSAGVEIVHQPAFPAVRGEAGRIDTTACGDTYRAALLTAILRAIDAQPGPIDARALLGHAMRAGSAAAAIKCRDLGRRGCPQRDELDALLQRSG
jgi:sugar/nucleoside kinase (ribokinase family)